MSKQSERFVGSIRKTRVTEQTPRYFKFKFEDICPQTVFIAAAIKGLFLEEPGKMRVRAAHRVIELIANHKDSALSEEEDLEEGYYEEITTAREQRMRFSHGVLNNYNWRWYLVPYEASISLLSGAVVHICNGYPMKVHGLLGATNGKAEQALRELNSLGLGLYDGRLDGDVMHLKKAFLHFPFESTDMEDWYVWWSAYTDVTIRLLSAVEPEDIETANWRDSYKDILVEKGEWFQSVPEGNKGFEPFPAPKDSQLVVGSSEGKRWPGLVGIEYPHFFSSTGMEPLLAFSGPGDYFPGEEPEEQVEREKETAGSSTSEREQ